ncbi:MAG: protein kinase [Acidobacteriota bacterium]
MLYTLGQGGMGEVVLAEDPRLRRRVAIKRLLVSSDEDAARTDEQRRRFQREARILARLRHPAIVQVFDLITVDGDEHLVMEHVDGPNLRRFLDAEGPLPTAEAVSLARRIAEGLDHAHQHGVVHRDLKCENVLIDADGEPRIADFGLARLDPRSPSGDKLTNEHQVLGTLRAMAPEQLSGGVEARSDLFALGVLMVEMCTGRSPFAGAGQWETIGRILSSPPRLGAIDSVPELAELVRHLLEKDPALRPRSAGEVVARLDQLAASWSSATETRITPAPMSSKRVATREPTGTSYAAFGLRLPEGLRRRRRVSLALVAAVLILTVGGLLLRSRLTTPIDPLHIAVLAPEVRTPAGDEGEILSIAVRNAAIRALSELERVVALGAAQIDAVAAGRSPRQIAYATAADQVLTSSLHCDAVECWLALSRLEGASGEVLWSATVQSPRSAPQTLALAVENAMVSGLPQRRRGEYQPLPPALSAELISLRLAPGLQAAHLEPVATLDRLDALRQQHGAHLDFDLWRARVAVGAFTTSRESTLRDRALRALEQAAEQAPDDPRVGLTRVHLELVTGRLDDAERTLAALERQIPGDVRVSELRARWWLSRGEDERALQAIQQAAARRPSWERLYNLARMASQLGKIDLAHETLAVLEQRAPGNRWGRRLSANLELKFGDLDRAAELFEELTRERPDLGAWSNLGIVHLLRRDGAAAVATLEKARALAPESPLVLLNLADARLLAGDDQVAGGLYREVLRLLEGSAESDTQTLTSRAQALARLGRGREAVAAIERAVARASDEPAVRFEAAYVYAIVGDRVSAERNMERALELGYDRRWFSLPVFDGYATGGM